jgi:hypothetical protein
MTDELKSIVGTKKNIHNNSFQNLSQQLELNFPQIKVEIEEFSSGAVMLDIRYRDRLFVVDYSVNGEYAVDEVSDGDAFNSGYNFITNNFGSMSEQLQRKLENISGDDRVMVDDRDKIIHSRTPNQHSDTGLDINSPAVQNYLTILQGVVSRMAGNSANCKTWCVSIVSAILVLIADKGKPDYAFIALIPVALFCLLDAYYLAQERAFREIYKEFVGKLVVDNATVEDLFSLRSMQGFHVAQATCDAITSFAVYPFYGILAGTLTVARCFLTK